MAEQNTEATDAGTLDAEEQEIEEILSKVDDTPLSEDDWNIVVIETKALSVKWDDLVVYLGLHIDLIDNTIRPASNPWNEALKHWIKRNYNTKRFGLPSWKTLLKAVAEVDKLQCKKLADKHKGYVDQTLLAGKLVVGKTAGDSMFADSALGRSAATAAGVNENLLARGLMDLDMGMRHSESSTANNLHIASLMGDLEAVKRLIEKEGFNPLQTDGKDGQNALHYAAWGGQLKVMKYFIRERRCNPTCQDSRGATPLHTAAQCSHLDLVQYLVDEENVDPTCLTKTSDTPLHHACTCAGGNVDMVSFLVNAMTKRFPLKDVIESKGGAGWSPVHYAAYFGHLGVIKFFATNFDPLIVNDRGDTALHFAAKRGHLHIVKYFIEELKCNPSPVDTTPLHHAASEGHLEIVKYLTLDQHCDPLCAGKLGITPLHWAASFGQLEVIKFFVETLHCPADTRAGGNVMPIMLARNKGYHHIVQYLESMTK